MLFTRRGNALVGMLVAAFIATALPGIYPDQAATAIESRPEVSRTYTNPVSAGVVDTFPDPAMIHGKDGAWYVYGSSNPIFNSSGEDFEHILPIMRSTNMVTWEYVGDIYSADEAKPAYWSEGTRPWAPDIRYIDGTYNLSYSLSGQGVALLTADSPTGPWIDQGLIIPVSNSGCPTHNIDQATFTDIDGTHYMYWGSYDTMCVSKMTPDGRALEGTVTQVAQGRRAEGAFVVRRDDFYYFFYSDAGCCQGSFSGYTVKVGRSTSPLGPFVDDEGVDLMTPTTKAGYALATNGNGFTGTGHNAIQQDLAGQDWLVYHAVPTADPDFPPLGGGRLNALSKRPLMIDRLDWIDGWPVVRAGAGPSNAEQFTPVSQWSVGSTFTDGALAGWRSVGAGQSWTRSSESDAGGFAAHSSPESTMLVSEDRASGALQVQADLRFDDDGTAGTVGLVLGYQSGVQDITAWLDRGRGQLRVAVNRHGAVTEDSTPLPSSFDYGSWHVVTAQIRGAELKVEVSGDNLGTPQGIVAMTLPEGTTGDGSIGAASDGSAAGADNLGSAALHTPVTTKVPVPEAADLLPSHSDEFSGSGLPDDSDPAWNWIRGAGAGVTQAEGMLQWPTQRAELTNSSNTASVLLRDAPAGDFIVETKLDFDGVRGAQQAGILLYEKDDSYLKLVRSVLPISLVPGLFSQQTEFTKEGARLTTTPPMNVFSGPMFGGPGARVTWLRMDYHLDEQNGEHDVRMASSTNGENWQWGGTWSLPANGPLKIGLVSMNTAGATAKFDYVRTYNASQTLGTIETRAPRIEGVPLAGEELTASVDYWAPKANFSYQWLRDGTAIEGATEPRYVVQPRDTGTSLTVRLTGSVDGYNNASESSPPAHVTAASILTAGRPVVKQEALLGLVGTGLAPMADYLVRLDPSASDIGRVPTNERGELAQDVIVPAWVHPGHQRLVLRRGNVEVAGTSINIAAAGRAGNN